MWALWNCEHLWIIYTFGCNIQCTFLDVGKFVHQIWSNSQYNYCNYDLQLKANSKLDTFYKISKNTKFNSSTQSRKQRVDDNY